ncbi:MAG TPA: A24 family peptidase [Pirellulales bacterium]|jgi:prepilin signal peptidase PulO-like enzyme (type II secretory pathway)
MFLTLLALLFFGTCLGAMVNLGIYRLAYFRQRISPWCRTRNELLPRSWTDRIPVIGWWSLRQEEKYFGAGFWIRPMLLELCFAIGVAGLYWLEIDINILNISPQFPGLHPGPAEAGALCTQFSIHVVLSVLMMLATFIDIDERTIPDSITVPGTMIALVLAAFCSAPALPSLEVDPQHPLPDQLIQLLRFDYPAAENLTIVFQQSWKSLAVGMAIFLAWCFALLPRRWRLGVGIGKAWRVMWRRIAARDEWKWILPLSIAGCLLIGLAWQRGGESWHGLLTSLVGLAAGGGIIWLIRLIGSAVLGREAMGFGDVTLLAMIGAFFGWQPIVLVFFLSPFAGALVGLVQIMMGEENIIPYGPFLCLAALVVLIFWSPIWDYAGRMFAIWWLVPSAIVVCLPLLGAMLFGWKTIRNRLVG